MNSGPNKYLGWSVLDETVVTVGDRSQIDEAELRDGSRCGVRKTTEVVVMYDRVGSRNGNDENGHGDGGIEMNGFVRKQ